MEVSVKIEGLDEVTKDLGVFGDREVPISFATTLTWLAKAGQGKIRESNLPSHFLLRRPSFLKAGVRIRAATKANLQAVVEDIDDFMERQETGETKTPEGGRMLAVPLSGARKSPRSIVSDQDRPKEVMQRGGFIRGNVMFAVALKKTGARRRLSKFIAGITAAATWSRKVIPMYALVPSARMTRRYGFLETVQRVVEDQFESTFLRAIAKYTDS